MINFVRYCFNLSASLGRFITISVGLLLFGCASEPYEIRLHPSPNQNSRISTIVLHYTALNDADSLKVLTCPSANVSAHYLVPQGCQSKPCLVYQLVEDEQKAWHAGRSGWRQQTGVNAYSIGIEIVNQGYPDKEEKLPINQRHWAEFEEQQIQTVAALVTKLAQRYEISPQRIIGHSDVAPGRKTDPGLSFPWRRLHDEFGIGAWPDPVAVTQMMMVEEPSDVLSWQQALAEYGYTLSPSGHWDKETKQVLRAFQLHFRPERVDGQPDRESWAILQVLLNQYVRS